MGAVPGRVAVGLLELVRVADGWVDLPVGRADASGRVRWAEGLRSAAFAGAERTGGELLTGGWLGGRLGAAVGVAVAGT